VWFHKLRSHKKGIAEIQVSHKLMPFLVELSSQYTAYSLHVAMSLKSKWSQRMYELCQNGKVQTASESQLMNCERLLFWKKNTTDALLNERVQVAKRELKELYDLGNVMFILNSPKNEKAEPLKCYVSNCSENTMNVKLQTIYSWN
jgi:hypothetical protein